MAIPSEKQHGDVHHTQHVETIDTLEDIKGTDFTLPEAAIPDGYFRSLKFIGSMFAIGSAFGCGVAGFTFAAPILGYINEDIGPDANITWVALSYLLTSSIGLIIVGRLTDLFGRRWFFIIGNAIATLGSVVCATAPSIPALIAGETLVGVGASVQLSYACKTFVASSRIQPVLRLYSCRFRDRTNEMALLGPRICILMGYVRPIVTVNFRLSS